MEDLAASADGMVISLRRADADLSAVMHRLENEFQQRFEGREVMKQQHKGKVTSLDIPRPSLSDDGFLCAGEPSQDYAEATHAARVSFGARFWGP